MSVVEILKTRWRFGGVEALKVPLSQYLPSNCVLNTDMKKCVVENRVNEISSRVKDLSAELNLPCPDPLIPARAKTSIKKKKKTTQP